ncbi:hypothetical protein SeMB42_g04161 [Synchytrium endobioticum]|uniref:Early meiotic induction protein 1 n=1 Tax=Synchytrium endobioticum TaxID=286115 RepID=A0A507D0F7_9FUNG|nr:hypothetical protein SeMB42_g04161 [Synchytrium endobioticum]TPX50408.1 hypothetical protein SeLEV6574_g00894 [Synchytrium endobioticum]
MSSKKTLPDGKVEYECSAWAAMDALQLCFTPLPQLRHYYRYGAWKSCSAYRKEFVFCLQMKGKSHEDAQDLIKEYHEDKLKKKFQQRSSVGVWQIRDKPPADFPPPLSSIPTNFQTDTPSL